MSVCTFIASVYCEKLKCGTVSRDKFGRRAKPDKVVWTYGAKYWILQLMITFYRLPYQKAMVNFMSKICLLVSDLLRSDLPRIQICPLMLHTG